MKAKLNGLLLPLVAFGEMLQGHHRLLKARHGLSIGGSRKCLDASLPEVCDSMLPQLAPHGMVCQPLDVLA